MSFSNRLAWGILIWKSILPLSGIAIVGLHCCLSSQSYFVAFQHSTGYYDMEIDPSIFRHSHGWSPMLPLFSIMFCAKLPKPGRKNIFSDQNAATGKALRGETSIYKNHLAAYAQMRLSTDHLRMAMVFNFPCRWDAQNKIILLSIQLSAMSCHDSI